MKTWQIQEAKTHLSEVIELAQSEGPQEITRHGKARAVLLSVGDYEALTKGKKAEPNLIDFLRSGPYLDDVDLERSKDTGRDIDL